MQKLKFVLFIGLCAFLSSGFAQTKPAAQKYKAPKLTTLLSTYKDSVTLSKEEAKRVIDMPLRIVDDQKTVYTIASYQFIYRRIAFLEDEATGKVSKVSTIANQRFTTTPLTPSWIIPIREQLQAEEELYFYDIIVKDPQGRVMFAPDLKIKVI